MFSSCPSRAQFGVSQTAHLQVLARQVRPLPEESQPHQHSGTSRHAVFSIPQTHACVILICSSSITRLAVGVGGRWAVSNCGRWATENQPHAPEPLSHFPGDPAHFRSSSRPRPRSKVTVDGLAGRRAWSSTSSSTGALARQR